LVEHQFGSFEDFCVWLGCPPVQSTSRGGVVLYDLVISTKGFRLLGEFQLVKPVRLEQ
jgi:hypothetical protein